MGFCNCSMFCCALLCVYSGFAIILMGKRELVAFFSSWCLVNVVWLFLAVQRVCLQFVIVAFPDHAHLRFFFFALRLVSALYTCTDCALSEIQTFNIPLKIIKGPRF